MIKVLTGIQMKNIDKKAMEDLRIPGLILMENAGRAVFEQVDELLEEFEKEDKNVLVICGKGNNAGDGFVAARHLIQNGIQTYVLSLYRETDFSGEVLVNHNILKNFTDIIYFYEIDIEKLQDIIASADVIVDAIFGTGLNSDIKGDINTVIETINEYSEGFIVSVDIPSGVNSDNGKILGNAVIADYTVTFFAPKLGTVIYPGVELAGNISISDISIPEFLLREPEYNINLITENYVSASLPVRPENSHKGTFGSVFNIAGSFGLTGAAYLCSCASLKTGAGYSALATPESLVSIYAGMTSEIVYVPLRETSNKAISIDAVSEALDKSQKFNVFLIGPGIGTAPATVDFVFEITQNLVDRGLTVIFDADALNCLAKRDSFVLPFNSIITPHPKELSRLLKISVEEILHDRIGAARSAAQRFNTVVVLKGARTIIAEPNGNIYINPTGNSALAKAGTGDILSGMIAGFAAQGADIKKAAILGTFLHGITGDIAINNLTEYSVMAEDLLDYIPDAIKYIANY